jgi:hypothetical protein
MRVLLPIVLLSALVACDTETIELRTERPDAAPDAAIEADAEPPRCVCLRACIDSRDCQGLGSEVCDLGQDVCEETEPLVECETSASCTDSRTCVREDDPGTGCD